MGPGDRLGHDRDADVRGDELDGIPDMIAVARCKSVLERAYEEFAASSPLEKRVFKVLKEAVEPKAPKNFVPLDDLK